MSSDVLSALDKNDLDRFGIEIFKHKSSIFKHINNLITNSSNDNNMQYIEGHSQTAYI